MKSLTDNICLLRDECVQKKNAMVGSFIGLGALSTSILGFNIPQNLWYYPVIYGALIIIPIILGMAGKIEFKWVLLWEAIVLLPFALVVGGGLLLAILGRH